jgi:hypothetical protein
VSLCARTCCPGRGRYTGARRLGLLSVQHPKLYRIYSLGYVVLAQLDVRDVTVTARATHGSLATATHTSSGSLCCGTLLPPCCRRKRTNMNSNFHFIVSHACCRPVPCVTWSHHPSAEAGCRVRCSLLELNSSKPSRDTALPGARCCENV